jgi:tRNA pseudouridine38-40 synthase
MVYRLTLGYRGTEYAGWQRQSNALAVQEVVEEALAGVLGHSVRLVGAGRTDAGVHARGQVAHFESGRSFPRRGLVHATNRALPPDIRVMQACRIAEGFHARKHATSKQYRYRLVRTEVLSPLDALFAVPASPRLDLEAMRSAAQSLVGRHDFTAFALAGGNHRSPMRTIHLARWLERGPALVLRIEGDGFLRGMVRSIVGTLLEVGNGRREPSELEALLAGRPRAEAGPTAPAKGLELHRVTYPARWKPLPD